jgi:hypothetical protein
VHEGGSEELGISAETLSGMLDDAYASWLGSTCEMGTVSLAIDNRGFAECGAPEYNVKPKDRNANVWMFNHDAVSSDGPAQGSSIDSATLAVTTISFNEDTAEIYDADVELISLEFTTSETDIDIDLASVVVHEAGHFLGLDHSLAPDATMQKGYTPGTIGNRTLSGDDVAGICATYPEGREFPGGQTCEPRGKYSPKCEGQGCDCGIARERRSGSLPLLLTLVTLALSLRRLRHPRRAI